MNSPASTRLLPRFDRGNREGRGSHGAAGRAKTITDIYFFDAFDPKPAPGDSDRSWYRRGSRYPKYIPPTIIPVPTSEPLVVGRVRG